MSGVEAVAGLALGVFPLLISAVEHYDDCLRPFLRYKNFAKEADRFRDLLRIQKSIFKNQCRILLEEIVDHDVASSMLDGAAHPSRSDLELEKQLCQLLGDSRDACTTTVEMIGERLRDIEGENRDLESTIEQESLRVVNTTDVIGSKQWRRRVAKKLRFSFSNPRLDQTLAALRTLNDDFRTLSSQTLKANTLQLRRQVAAPQTSYQEVERYKIIGQASRQVYEALGKACTKHTEHQAHFCVEVEQAIINGDHSAQVKFNMAYTHSTLAGSADQGDLIWFVVDSTSGDAKQIGQFNAVTGMEDGFTHSLKRQIEHKPGTAKTKVKKSVRFQSPALGQGCTPTLPTAALANALLSSDSMRKDFCDFIRRRLGSPLQASECVGILENSDNCRNAVYPSSAKCCSRRRQPISLGQVISKAKQQPVGQISLYERLHLAKTLAIAVLQYHSTPWLTRSWRSEDVYFFSDDLNMMQGESSLESPHVNVRIKGPCGQISRASTFPAHTLVRNPLLFSLGVVLLEIAHSSTLENLQRPIDFADGQENQYTEFFAARRLAKTASTDMGGKYLKVVERLVECDFGCGTDLNDPKLQAAFHNDVICPLERLEQKLHDLHFDP